MSWLTILMLKLDQNDCTAQWLNVFDILWTHSSNLCESMVYLLKVFLLLTSWLLIVISFSSYLKQTSSFSTLYLIIPVSIIFCGLLLFIGIYWKYFYKNVGRPSILQFEFLGWKRTNNGKYIISIKVGFNISKL